MKCCVVCLKGFENEPHKRWKQKMADGEFWFVTCSSECQELRDADDWLVDKMVNPPELGYEKLHTLLNLKGAVVDGLDLVGSLAVRNGDIVRALAMRVMQLEKEAER